MSLYESSCPVCLARVSLHLSRPSKPAVERMMAQDLLPSRLVAVLRVLNLVLLLRLLGHLLVKGPVLV